MNPLNEKKVERYVTKYWQNNGIQLLEGRIIDGSYFQIEGIYTFIGRNDHFATKEEAIKDAEKKKQKKIASLKKQLSKIEKITF